jgi:C-terminal processing protease CtpA/Prc
VGVCLGQAGLVAILIGLASAAIAQPLPPRDTILFGWDEWGVAIEADGHSVHQALDVISAATGIPILVDPGLTNRLNGVYRKRRLEDLLLDLSPGLAITYRYDERMQTHVIDRVHSATRVGEVEKLDHLRTMVVQAADLEEGIKPEVSRPIRYTGIGAAIRPAPDRGGIWVEPLSSSSPAARAGLALGDVVTKVDGVSVTGMTNMIEVSRAIRGPENTDVVLTVQLPDGRTVERRVKRVVFEYRPEPES